MVIHWFRQDLRLKDNPSLCAAIEAGEVLLIYIWDTKNNEFPLGAASRWWLHHALIELNKNLQGHLNIYLGDPVEILCNLLEEKNIQGVFWNRCYEPWQIRRDTVIKEKISARGVSVSTFQSGLLWEPWTVSKSDGTPYKVFTPYYFRGCLNASEPRQPFSAPALNSIASQTDADAVSLDSLELLSHGKWETQLLTHWQIGEHAAQEKLHLFVDSGLQDYKSCRDFPAIQSTSQLSPYLHFGEISPHQVWHTVRAQGDDENTAHFLRELAWREFSYYLLYHFPQLPKQNWQSKFDIFPWENNMALLKAWQLGKTGYPIIDAGMRELWQTGSMHNRVRMLVASFLTKNCLIDWRLGAQWFWDCLVDADLASNSASWQWVAGCGADAGPYFRIFNPVLQSKKFDLQGHYIRNFVPEISALDNRDIHMPAAASPKALLDAKIILGIDYPVPIIDLAETRKIALALYRGMRN